MPEQLRRRMLRFCAAVQLKELKTELGSLRVAEVTGGAPNKLAKMCVPNPPAGWP